MKIKILFLSVLCLALTSCANTFYQVYEVEAPSLKQENNSLVYENEDCKIFYNLWAENGSMKFVLLNKTDKDIIIDMKRSFFIRNGAALDYFTNAEYAISTNYSANISTGGTVGFTEKYDTGTLLDLWPDQYSANATIGKYRTRRVAYGSTTTVKEPEQVCIPANSWKVINKYEYSILPTLILTCDNHKDFPRYRASVDISQIPDQTFGNRLTYTDGNGETKKISNTFKIVSIENYSKKAAIEKVTSKEKCWQYDKRKVSYIFKIGGPNKLYRTYSKTKQKDSYILDRSRIKQNWK